MARKPRSAWMIASPFTDTRDGIDTPARTAHASANGHPGVAARGRGAGHVLRMRPSPGLQRLHVDHARYRLDRARDLRRDLEAARELHFHLGFEVEHHYQRHVAVGSSPGGRRFWLL